MWEQYRKLFIPTQIFVLALCGGMYYSGSASGGYILAVFIAMQIGGLLGAMWGARLKRKMEARRDRLPLERH